MEHVTSKVNQRLGLLRRIKHLLPYNACLLYYNSLVLPIFDYADLVWGDKDNAVLMNNLQVLQNCNRCSQSAWLVKFKSTQVLPSLLVCL